MSSQILTSRVEVDDLIRGLTFMGTGGGGRPAAGRSYLYRLLDEGKPFGWTDPTELPDDGWACSVFSVGSTAPRPADFVEDQSWPGYGIRKPGSAMPGAIRELERYTGTPISVVFSVELGAHNTPGPMFAAAELGIKLVDGDASGRAVPEASQVTPEMQKQTMWPAAIADEWGNALVIRRATSLDVAEKLLKGVSIVTKLPDSYAICAVAAYLIPVAKLKEALILGSISRSYELGRSIRLAREAARDPIAAVLESLDAVVLFRGVVSHREWESIGGYQIGATDIAGADDFTGHSFRIWFKNEHHITWLDGRPYVTSPDLLAVVESATAEPITNTYLAEGMNVTVIGVQASSPFRTAEGIATLGPRHFGFDLDYRPIEELVRR